MNLKYRVLWIEDQMKSIRGKYRVIKKYIEEEKGFLADIKHVETFDEFETEIGYGALKEYDLLLVDLNLDEDDRDSDDDGNKIISNIRDKNIYTEIIFYSSQYEDLQSKLQSHFIEGIFTSERNLLQNKVKKIIDVTLHKIQDVNNLRGLILAEVAELDRLKKKIIKEYTKKNEDHNKLKKYIKENVFKNMKDDIDTYSFLFKNDNSYETMNVDSFVDNLIYDSYKKARTVNKVKSLESRCKSVSFIFDDYYKDIIKKRNVFAHVEEKTRENGTKFLRYPDGSDLEFDEEHCIKIRKDIKKYKTLLEEMMTLVQV